MIQLRCASPFQTGTSRTALWVSDDKTRIGKHEVWFCEESRLARARTADDNLQKISPVQLTVHAHLQVLGQYDVFACILVAVLLVQFPDTAPGCRTVFLAGSGVLLSGVVEQDRAAVEQQKNSNKFCRVRCPAQGKRRFHRFGELCGKVKDRHAGFITPCHKNCQPDNGDDKRRPHWGGAAK